jgi:hypothetical protein
VREPFIELPINRDVGEYEVTHFFFAKRAQRNVPPLLSSSAPTGDAYSSQGVELHIAVHRDHGFQLDVNADSVAT